MKPALFLLALVSSITAFSQQIKVEGDKTRDLSMYHTFKFGEGQITTPRDQRTIPDSTVHRWVREAVMEELKEKGLRQSDTADLVVSYLTGSDKRSDMGSVGPLGMTPGSTSQTYMRDYLQGNVVIDVNDTRNKTLIWRISAITESGQGQPDKVMDEIVEKGFRKFSLKPKKHK